MDVSFGDFGDSNDACHCVCGSCHLADSWVFPVFAVGIDVGQSFCFTSGFESAVDVFQFLDGYL